jgi:hypothetical protein
VLSDASPFYMEYKYVCVCACVLDREIEVDSLLLDYGMDISCDTCLPLIWCRWRLGRGGLGGDIGVLVYIRV